MGGDGVYSDCGVVNSDCGACSYYCRLGNHYFVPRTQLFGGLGRIASGLGLIASGRYLGRSHGRWNGDGRGVGGNREGGDSANNCSGGVQLFVNKHIT